MEYEALWSKACVLLLDTEIATHDSKTMPCMYIGDPIHAKDQENVTIWGWINGRKNGIYGNPGYLG